MPALTQPRTLDGEHRAALEAALGHVHTAVALEMHCELGDTGADACEHACVRAHFPFLEDALAEWNEAVAEMHATPDRLWRRFASSARERGITEPPFMVGVLVDQVATVTVERTRRHELERLARPPLEHFSDRVDGERYVSVYLGGRRVAALPDGEERDVRRRVEAADTLIRALFEEALACPEARLIAAAQDELLMLKRRLLHHLDARSPDAAIRPVAACPVCAPAARRR